MYAIFFRAALAVLTLVIARAEASPSDPFPVKFTALFGTEVQIGGIARDAGGNIVVAGTTNAALPVTAGAFQTDYKPAMCSSGPPDPPCPVAFAAKLSHDGTSLQYLTYLGASDSAAYAVAVDQQGDAWIAGAAFSPDLPVTPGAFQTQLKGQQNAFLLELNPTGSKVLFATYLGGGYDQGFSLAMDASSNVYVAGTTESPDFPVTAGAFQTSPGVGMTAFAAKFNNAGRLIYSTFFHGGSLSGTNVYAIAADASGSLYLTGSGPVPTTPNAFHFGSGPYWAFVSKLDPTGSNLVYSTYLAANYPAVGNRIAVDGQGNAYIAGGISLGTGSAPQVPSTFPITRGAFQTSPPDFEANGNRGVGFVSKLSVTGSQLIYSTYIYASDDVGLLGLAVDAAGAAILAAGTYAFDFPTTAGALRQCNPQAKWGLTGVLLKLAPDGSHLLYSTYLGSDRPWAIAIDGSGEVYLAGNDAAALSIVPGSFGWTGSGAFVAGLDLAPLPAGSVSCVASAASRNAAFVSPGEIVDIFGSAIGPATTAYGNVSGGQLSTTLAGVQVLVNGIAAPLASAGLNQIRAVIPFETSSVTGTATIQILNGASTIQPITLPIVPLAPALFTVDGGATGQLLMVNEDGTLNSKTNPAREGSVVIVYATGLNNTQPPLPTGAIAQGAAPLAMQSQLAVGSAGFGQGEILYAGAAPGFVAGLTQINFRLPSSIFHGFAGIYLTGPGGSISQAGVYFFLK